MQAKQPNLNKGSIELEEEDEYDQMIRRSGCYQQHIALQTCYLDKKDWRLCREELNSFKVCFQKNQSEKDSAQKFTL